MKWINIINQEPMTWSLHLPYKPYETTFERIFQFLETVGLLDWRALYAIQYNIIMGSWINKDTLDWYAHRRTDNFCLAGGKPFAQEILARFPIFLRNSRNETRVIRCTNNGLHMKWKYSYIWICHMSSKNTLKLKRNSCLFHFDGRRYQWYDPCDCWLQIWPMPFKW